MSTYLNHQSDLRLTTPPLSSHVLTRFFEYQGMRDRGIYLPPSMYEAWFVNLAFTKDDIDKTISAAREVLVSM